MKKIMMAICLVLISTIALAAPINFQLQKGWNLLPKVYVPKNILPTNESPSPICHDMIKLDFQYSPLENKYYEGVYGRDLTGPNDPRVQQNQAFGSLYNLNTYPSSQYYNPVSANPGHTSEWVYLDSPCKITDSRPIIETVPNIDRKIYAGWNFLSVTEKWLNSSPRTIFQNCTVQKIYGWESYGQKWIDTSGVQMDQQFGQDDLDQTVVVKVAGECKLSGSLSPPGLP